VKDIHPVLRVKSLILILFILMSTSLKPQEKKALRLAMAQMLVEGGQKHKNLERAANRIEQAAKNSADIVLLPEAMDLGWTHSSAKTEADQIPGGVTFETLAKAAKNNKVFVCAGIIEKDGENTYNAAILINREGELILKHRKINELYIAHDLYDLGDRINVCETEFGTIGMLICADATAKDYVLARSIGYLGADLLLLPSSWAVEPNHDNQKDPYGGMWVNAFKSVSKEFNMTVVSVSNVGIIADGPWKSWKCIGNSMLVENAGTNVHVLPHGVDADTIVYHNITLPKRPGWGTNWYKYWGKLK